jgi:MULE transposase domain
MPLLHFVGCTAFNTTFTIAYAFMSKEEVADYTWALNALRQCITGYTSNVFATDRERALISAIQRVYTAGNICICLWHINKNVLLHCKKLFSNGLEFDRFLKVWNYICYSATEEDYFSNVVTL